MAVARPKLGIALGSGSARGWSHIGVLSELAKMGVEPDIVCGCSIGAFVGAAYVNGDLAKLEEWVSSLGWKHVLGMFDVSLSRRGGLIKGDRLIEFFSRNFVDRDFVALPKPFACVATDLDTGREVWLREGSVANAVRASIALPGLFTPFEHDGRLLVDGGLVNPVPVSLCRALGADIVIAVDLGSDRAGHLRRNDATVPDNWKKRLLQRLGKNGGNGSEQTLPSLVEVLVASVHIMQVRISRSRLAGEPAEVVLEPRLGQIGLMDYHRGEEAITEGRAAVERMWPAISHALATHWRFE